MFKARKPVQLPSINCHNQFDKEIDSLITNLIAFEEEKRSKMKEVVYTLNQIRSKFILQQKQDFNKNQPQSTSSQQPQSENIIQVDDRDTYKRPSSASSQVTSIYKNIGTASNTQTIYKTASSSSNQSNNITTANAEQASKLVEELSKKLEEKDKQIKDLQTRIEELSKRQN